MAYTFLDAVNDVLKRVGSIKGDAGELSSFTESARQRDIDIAILAWNDMIHDLFTLGLFSKGSAESTFVLADGVREYDLATDFEMFAADNIREETKQYLLSPYPDGYESMWDNQIKPDNFSGQPNSYAINTSNGKIRINTTPQTEQVGDTLKYLYMKRLSLSIITDVFPFSDTVVDMLGIAVAELWTGYIKGERNVDSQAFKNGRSRAISYLTQDRDSDRYA